MTAAPPPYGEIQGALSPMRELVQAYYGKQLTSSSDLRTTACCDGDAVEPWLRPLLAAIHPEVNRRYYGCGLICPPLLEGCRVLDLGCGAGRDVYLLAQLVGPRGAVVGIDMTPEQLAVAEAHHAHHAESFGFDNVTFLEGSIEALDRLALPPAGFDVVVSNCVLNLCPDKGSVLAGVRRLLKPGGEFYFSDVYVDRRLPETVRTHPILYGECLGGALYWNDFLRLARAAGFPDPRLVTDRSIALTEPSLAPLVGDSRFFSATYRLFHIGGLEDACEDHGQAVIYRGTVPRHPDHLLLDKHHRFETGRVHAVCGNTWRMLHDSRLNPHFSFIGDDSRHFGLFPGCGGGLPFDAAAAPSPASPSCC